MYLSIEQINTIWCGIFLKNTRRGQIKSGNNLKSSGIISDNLLLSNGLLAIYRNHHCHHPVSLTFKSHDQKHIFKLLIFCLIISPDSEEF